MNEMYTNLAEKARELEIKAETCKALDKASNVWMKAAMSARKEENKTWCIARAKFCKSELGKLFLSRK